MPAYSNKPVMKHWTKLTAHFAIGLAKELSQTIGLLAVSKVYRISVFFYNYKVKNTQIWILYTDWDFGVD